MKLNKASEDTLKGLAKLLKNLKEDDPAVTLSNYQSQVKALDKDLRQLRKHLGALPDVAQATADFRQPNVMIFRNEDFIEIKIADLISNPQAEQDLEQALNELRALRNEPPVSYGTNLENPCAELVQKTTPVIDLAHESLVSIRQTYVDNYGPLPDAMVGNDIDHEVEEIIKESRKWEVSGDDIGAALPEVITGTLTATSISPTYEPAIYVNPAQLDTGSNLIAIRRTQEAVFTEPLYRKKT